MSPVQQTKALRDALNLVYYYNTNSQVKKAVDQAILTRSNAPGLNHPPLFYASILMSFSRRFGNYFRIDLRGVRSFPEKIDDFFVYCYRNRTEYNKLNEIARNNRPEPTLKPPPQPLRRGFDISASLPIVLLNTYSSSRFKNFALSTQKTMQELADKYATYKRTASAAAGTIGGLTGLGVAGPIGGVVGAATGLAMPGLIMKGLGNTILQTGASTANTLGGILSGFITLPINLFFPIKWLMWGAIVILMFFSLGFSLPGFQGLPTTGGRAGNGSVDINSCQFIRSGVSQPIKSAKLISLIQEVASKSAVPASTLASVAMHETPSFVINAEDNHDAFGSNTTIATGCTHFGLQSIGSSPTGALGLMQVQPPKHIHDQIASAGKIPPFESVRAYDAVGVKFGAEMLGKTVDSLTLQDFCDVRTSIYLGAGVLLSKNYENPGKPPTNGEEVSKFVCRYFGGNTCLYPDHNSGPFHYGNDAKEDFKNCPTLQQTAVGSIGFSLTCPLDPINNQKFHMTCGTAANPAPNKCGHGVGPVYEETCNPFFYECVGKRYSDALYKAIDVSYPIGESTTQAPVSLPLVNGNQTIKWKFTNSVLSGNNSCNWGWKHTYTGSYNGHTLTLILTHLIEQNPITPFDSNGEIVSGSLVGAITSGVGTNCQLSPHLHTSIAVDGVWVEPEKEALMCAK